MISINKIEKMNKKHFFVSAKINDKENNQSVRLIATKNNKKLEIGKLFFKTNKAKCNLHNIDLLENGSYKIDALSSKGSIIDVSFSLSDTSTELHGSTNIIKIKKSTFEVTPISTQNSKIYVLSITDDENNLYVRIKSELPHIYNISCLTARHRINNNEINSLPAKNHAQGIYEITLSKNNIFDKTGIWDFYVKISSNGIDSFVRLDANSETLSNQNINCFYNNTLFKFQPYITQDGQLSLNIRDLTTTFSKLMSLDYNQSSFNIAFKINEKYSELYKQLRAKLIIDGKVINYAQINKCRFGNTQFTIPFEWFLIQSNNTNNIVELCWEIVLKNGDIHDLPFTHVLDEENYKSSEVLIYPSAIYKNNDAPISIKPYFNNANRLLFSTLEDIQYQINTIVFKEKIEIEIDANNDSNINIVAISKKDGNTIEFVKKNNKYISILNLKEISPIENAYFIHYIKDNKKHIINKTSPVLKSQFKMFKQNKVKLGSGNYISCIVCKNNLTSIEIRPLREHEKTTSKLSLFLSKCVAFTLKKCFKKDIWLIGENLGDVAQDNGFAFFKYALEKHNERVYYIIRKNSVHYHKLLPFRKNVIIYDSFKHKTMYHLASKLVVAHGIRDVLPSIKHPVIYRNDKDIVYLQHGILAMKRIGMHGNSYNNKIVKFVVSSDNEKRIMIRESKFRQDQIIVSGLPRFDDLYRYEEKPKRQIFIMPTWRDWLVKSEEEFLNSDFYRNYKLLLNDKDLDRFLSKNNYVIKILPHNEIYKQYIHLFKSSCDNILIANLAEDTVQKLITESSGMVTDYSSVAWDFLFMRKPALFFQFDVNEYLTKRGAYMSFQNHLPGHISYTYDDFISQLKLMIVRDCKFENIHLSKLNMFINNIDDQNCHRLYKQITSS